MKSKIVEEVKLAKYYGLSIDSTPDIAHIDQMTLILRYALQDMVQLLNVSFVFFCYRKPWSAAPF